MLFISLNMHQLINRIESTVKLDSEVLEKLNNYAKVETYLKNQHLLESGKRCNKIWFLKSGMVRKYHVHNGKEITIWIYTEKEIFTALQSFSQNTCANEYLQACENSEVIYISKSNYEKLNQFPQFLFFSLSLIKRAFVNNDIRTRNLNKKDAKGKYEYLKAIAPEIIKRAKLGHIASMIGITQETLSRIRKG
ncbi:Crp/Fnr family transcriptional regulator [Marinilabiliaceae bacterium JC017]|nr:Crp/Fnr family transcriptional regulator [Marinilabiliaceae bacterium JC017]